MVDVLTQHPDIIPQSAVVIETVSMGCYQTPIQYQADVAIAYILFLAGITQLVEDTVTLIVLTMHVVLLSAAVNIIAWTDFTHALIQSAVVTIIAQADIIQRLIPLVVDVVIVPILMILGVTQ